MANSEVGRRSTHNRPVNCTDVEVGDSALLFKSVNRNGPPRWRCPAALLVIGGTGVAAKVRGQTFKAAWYCVRRQMAPQDVGEVHRNPSETAGALAGMPSAAMGKAIGNDQSVWDGGRGPQRYECDLLSAEVGRAR